MVEHNRTQEHRQSVGPLADGYSNPLALDPASTRHTRGCVPELATDPPVVQEVGIRLYHLPSDCGPYELYANVDRAVLRH